MTDEYVAFLKKQEGLRLTVYKDQVGLPTIGYGHLLKSFDVPPITEARAEQMLREDVGVAEEHALRLAPNLEKYPRRLAALTDLCFNVGAKALEGSGTVAAFKREDWSDAAQRFVKWNKGRVKGELVELPVLTRRRKLLVPWITDGA